MRCCFACITLGDTSTSNGNHEHYSGNRDETQHEVRSESTNVPHFYVANL